MMLTVSRPGSLPVPNPITIDVYDTACEAAIGAGVEFNLYEVTNDCTTNLADFVAMAKTWLVDYTLTEAAPKPLAE